MKKKLLLAALCIATTITSMAACGNAEKETTKKQPTEKVEQAQPEQNIELELATESQIQAYMNDSDENTILVDARPQESYSGWALEGASYGGHLKNAVLFSARWLDCEYSQSASRDVYLDRALKDQNITLDKNVIVYDYTGKQAAAVGQYLKEQGVKSVSIFQANQLIDTGVDLVSYTNYNRFIPSDIVKNISDVKTGQEKALSEQAQGIVGNELEKVVLVDVGWGNANQSSYFSAGHVPGAVHINTDSYERPRVYVPEKRSDYAKEWRLISMEEFRDTVCTQYGITQDSIVILTGTASAPQGRLGFMLRTLGVKVYVMSGNLTAWNYNEFKLDTDVSTLVQPNQVTDFGSSTISNPEEILWTDDIRKILSGEVEGQVVDNRVEEEWLGQYSGYGYHDLAGRIEGSSWCLQGTDKEGDYFENADYTPRTQKEVQAYLESNELDINKTMAFFCGDSWGAAKIAYWSQSVDLNNVKEWGNGWIPWSNEGNEFIDHTGKKVHYDKYQDTVLDENGADVSDGINILDDAKEE